MVRGQWCTSVLAICFRKVRGSNSFPWHYLYLERRFLASAFMGCSLSTWTPSTPAPFPPRETYVVGTKTSISGVHKNAQSTAAVSLVLSSAMPLAPRSVLPT